ncbi:hypothetical protein VTO42DRAFT_753 [Malbranchea cinnamomea]
MNATLHASLSDVESKLSAFLSALTSSPTAAAAPAATLALIEADDALANALQTLRVHQTNYARILRLRAEASRLEERVKSIVREIGQLGDDIDASRHGGAYAEENASDSDSSDDDDDGDGEADGDVSMGADPEHAEGVKRKKKSKIKEVDYKILMDFARRISRYNVQAAADAAAGIGTKPPLRQQQQQQQQQQQKDEGLAAVTQEATSWLDESARQTRGAWLLPYPSEDRIRMGLMGQLQAAAAERGVDIEQEVDRLMASAPEGRESSLAGAVPGAGAAGGPDVSGARLEPGPAETRVSNGHAAEPAAPQTAKFDLDLYDPDADD